MKKTMEGDEERLYKDTALGDDASIYHKRDDETEKQKWSKMNKEQRLRYFRDYYLFKLILGVLAVAVVIFSIWHFTKPKMENVLYVAVVDETLNADEKNELQSFLKERYNATGKYQNVLIDDTFYTRDDGLSRMQVYLRNNEIDLIIADKETFSILSAYGYMQDLNAIFDDSYKTKYADDFYYTEGYKDVAEVTFEDKEVGQGDRLAYGLEISKSEKFSKMSNLLKDPVIGIVVDAPNIDNAKDFVNILMEE